MSNDIPKGQLTALRHRVTKERLTFDQFYAMAIEAGVLTPKNLEDAAAKRTSAFHYDNRKLRDFRYNLFTTGDYYVDTNF